MRYVAPDRAAVAAGTFEHPAYARVVAHRDLLAGTEWPDLDVLNEQMGVRVHPASGVPLRFVPQDPALLRDGLHYETRILERGEIATRACNWHDLINALIWIEHTALKAALNLRQARDVACTGSKGRTRGQCALTHFDEAGVLVLVRDPQLLACWDRHDWHELFWSRRASWSDAAAPIEVVVFGHALLEHLLRPHQLLVGKALVASAAVSGASLADAECQVACGISDGRLLADPQELRPLPLSGIPRWHEHNGGEAFYREAECVRALRPGRRYPAPSSIGPS